MKKTTLYLAGIAVLIVVMAVITGCYRNDAVYVQPPVAVQQPVAVAPTAVAVQPSNDGFWSGYLMGHLMSGGYYGYGYHAPVVQHNTTIVQQSVTRNVTVNKAVIAAPRANTYVYRPASSYRASSSFRSSSSYRRR